MQVVHTWNDILQMNWMAVYIVCSIYEWFLFDRRGKLLYFLKEVWIISLTKKVVYAEINRRDINANMNKLFAYIFAKSVDDARNWRWPEIWIMIEMIMNVFSCWCPYTVAACYVEMIYVTYNPTLRIYHCSHRYNMMTSSNGIIFRVAGPLCRELTGHQWIPLTKASDAEFWCFLLCAPERMIE